MSGETSKVTGDLGENSAKIFFDFLGWKKRTATSFDFDCAVQSHKTPTDRDKEKHGIDFVYTYTCPYLKKEKVILVDSKTLKWGTATGKIKNESTLTNEITGFVGDLHQKVTCASLSKEFKTKTGITNFAKPCGLIFYFCHDGNFKDEQFREILESVSLPKDDLSSLVFLVGNTQINMLYSMFKHIEGEKNRLGTGSTHKFCYFELERTSVEGAQTDFLTIESLYSNFIFVKIFDPNGTISNHVYYFGSYEQDSIKMFVSALYKFQIHLMDNLVFYPVSMKSSLGSLDGIQNYFTGNKLVYEEKEVTIRLGEIDTIEYKLK